MAEFPLIPDLQVNRPSLEPVHRAPVSSADIARAFQQAMRQPARPAPYPVPHALPPLNLNQRLVGFVSSPPVRSGGPSYSNQFNNSVASTLKQSATSNSGSSLRAAPSRQPSPQATWPGQVSFGSGQFAQGNKNMFEFQFAIPALPVGLTDLLGKSAAQAATDSQQVSGFGDLLSALLNPAKVQPPVAPQASALPELLLPFLGQLGMVFPSAVPAQPQQPQAAQPQTPQPQLLNWLPYLGPVPQANPDTPSAQPSPAAPQAPGDNFIQIRVTDTYIVVPSGNEVSASDQASAPAPEVQNALADFFPDFFPLSAAAFNQPAPQALDFTPGLTDQAASAAGSQPLVFSFSYVQVLSIEVPAPQADASEPQIVLIPTALEARPPEAWLIALLEACGFAARLAQLAGQASAAPQAIPQDSSQDDAGQVSSNDEQAAPQPVAQPAAAPARPHVAHTRHPHQTHAAAQPQTPAQAPAPASTDSEPAQQAPVILPDHLIHQLAFDLLLANAGFGTEIQSDLQNLLQNLPFIARPPLAAGQEGQTARPVEAPSVLDISFVALLIALPRPAQAQSDEQTAGNIQVQTAVPDVVSAPVATPEQQEQPDQPTNKDNRDSDAPQPETSAPVSVPFFVPAPLTPSVPEAEGEAQPPVTAAAPVTQAAPVQPAQVPVTQAAPVTQEAPAEPAQAPVTQAAQPQVPVIPAAPAQAAPAAPQSPSAAPVAVQPAPTAAPQAPPQPAPAPDQPVVPIQVQPAVPDQPVQTPAAPVAPAPAAQAPVQPEAVPAPVQAAPAQPAQAPVVQTAPAPAVPAQSVPAPVTQAAPAQPAQAPVVQTAPVQVAPAQPVPPAPAQTAVAPAAPVAPQTPVAAPAQSAPQPELHLLSLLQGTLAALPQPTNESTPAPAQAPTQYQVPAARLNLLDLRLGQIQVGMQDPAARQPARPSAFGQLSPDAELLRAELIQPPAQASPDQNTGDDDSSRRQDERQQAFTPPAPAPVPAVAFHFRPDSLMAAPKPHLMSAEAAPTPLSAASSEEAPATFSNYLSHGAHQVLRQVEHFTSQLTGPTGPQTGREAQGPGAAAASGQVAQQAPLTATQVIHAINHDIPVHIADFPAFVNSVMQTLDPGSRVVQSFEVTLRPADLGQVTAQFSMTADNKMSVNLYTQSSVTAQTLEACKQEIQQIVDRTSLSLGQVNVRQAIAPSRQSQGGNNSGGSFGSSQQGTSAADYSSRQFRRRNRQRRGEDKISSDDTGMSV